MSTTNINIMKDFSEIVPYNNPHIPIYTRRSLLSSYRGGKALCHWHDDVEFIAVLSGYMLYYINGKVLSLKPNDVLIVNSRQLHYGYSNGNDDCDFICTLINPSIFKGNPAIYETFVQPVINSSFTDKKTGFSDNKTKTDIFRLMKELAVLAQKKKPDNTMRYLGIAHILWQEMFNLCRNDLNDSNPVLQTEVDTAKSMVSFIYQHYQENLSLVQIAASAGVCRNKCCQLFRKYIKQTPIDFLNSYRLEKSKYLLQNSSYTITQIAFQCGFNSVSYYIELFRRSNKCTPRQYRTNHQTK